MRMTVDRSIPKRSAASLWLSSPVASCSHSSYFWLGLRNRLARRPRRSRPESCWVISTLLLEAEGPYRMRRNQNPDVGHEVRRKTAPALMWSPLGDLGVCESGDVGCVELLEFNGGAPAQGAVASLPVVEDLQVLKDRVGQLDASIPPPAIQQLSLHPTPEGLDHGIVEGVTDRPHRGQQPGVLGALGERPGGELA